MNDMLSRIYKLIEQDDIKPTQLAVQLGLSNSAFSDWKKGKASPSLKALQCFADYFDVSLDYLVYGKEKSSPIRIENRNTMNQEDTDLLNAYHQLTPELRLKALGYIEGMAATMSAAASTDADKSYG